MKPMSLTSPESIAREYKGNKKAIANAARMGLVDPTAALMAGMFIDRMRSAASEEQKADTTVAQDVFNAPTQQQGLPQAPMQAQPQPQQPRPQMAQAQGIPGAQMAAAQPQMAPGVEGLPTGDVGNYADGGIVAFAEGMTDEQARALGYSNAAEYYAFQDLRGDAAGEVTALPVDRDTEVTRLPPTFEYDRTPMSELVSREVPRRGNYLTGINSIRDNTSMFGGPDQSTPFDRPRGVTTKADAAGVEGRQAVRDTFGLAGIMKGADLNTPFNRLPRAGETTPAMADVLNRRQAMREALRLPGFETPFNRAGVASRDATGSDLPPSVAANPEADKAKVATPKVDAYGLPIPDPAANLALAQQQAKSLIKVPQEESQADAIAATKQLYKDMGVDPDIYKKQGAKFEEERRSLKADKEEAKWTRLIEAGLGVMAGTSPFAAVNIGQGASPALKGFAQDIKDVKKADRELTRAQMALETTENQFKIDQSKSVQGRMEKNQERVDKAQSTLATTTATLGASINTLTGSQYDARLRDLTARHTADQSLTGTKYAADQRFRGDLAQAGAARHAADREERGIERLQKDNPGMSYSEAYLKFHKDRNTRDLDRYNSTRNAIGRANALIQKDSGIMMQESKLRELEKDPVGNAAAIKQQKEAIKSAKMAYYAQEDITEDSLNFVAEEDRRSLEAVRGSKPPPPPPPAAAAKPPKEGDVNKDRDGKKIVFQNGKWVYP